MPESLAHRVRLEGVIAFIVFIATIFLANYFVRNVGTECHPAGDAQVCVIPMWPSFGVGDGFAPSGVLWVGIAFTVRDLVQRRLGLRIAWLAILLGALCSAALDPALAMASAAAFFLSEGLDLLVYTPLQRRNLLGAVLASNAVGIVVDSFVFLFLAGIPLIFMEGQVIGKLWMTLLFLPLIWWIRRYDLRRGLMAGPSGVVEYHPELLEPA